MFFDFRLKNTRSTDFDRRWKNVPYLTASVFYGIFATICSYIINMNLI